MRTVTPAQAYATLGLAPPVPPVEQDAWADLAAAEAALRGLRVFLDGDAVADARLVGFAED